MKKKKGALILVSFATVGIMSTTAVLGLEDNQVKDDNKIVAMTNDGEISDGWKQIGDDWYYYENGYALRNKWKAIDGYKYYFKADGTRAQDEELYIYDEKTQDGDEYKFDSDGKLFNGWITDQWVQTYYYIDGQKFKTGSCEINGKSYLFRYAQLQKAYQGNVDGTYYLTDEDGAIVNKQELVKGWNHFDGETFYVDNGEVIEDQWKVIDGYKYYFDLKGNMSHDTFCDITNENNVTESYYFQKDGKVATGWFVVGYCKYYADAEGRIFQGIQEVDGVTYKFKYGGALDTDFKGILSNVYYETDENGIITCQIDNVKNGWNEINGEKIYISKDGAIRNDWLTYNGKKYYFNEDGLMLHDTTSFIKAPYARYGYEYRFNSEGEMVTGWYEYEDDKWYYDNNGRAVSGKKKIVGITYLFDDSGYLRRNYKGTYNGYYYSTDDEGVIIDEEGLSEGWNSFNDGKVYVENGKIITNKWKTIDRDRYYFNYEGLMVQNDERYYIDDEGWYCFDQNGHVVKGWYKNKSGCSNYFNDVMVFGKQEIAGDYYLFDDNGDLLVDYDGVYTTYHYITDENGIILQETSLNNGWNMIGNGWYYVENDQLITSDWKHISNCWYYFDYTGEMVTDSIFIIDDEYYYFDSNGKMTTGWIKFDGIWYYCDNNGHVLDGVQTINGKQYLFNDRELRENTSLIVNNILYVTDSNGVIIDTIKASNGWTSFIKGYYYYSLNGKFVISDFVEDNNKTYYMDQYGRMVANIVGYDIDDELYSFNASGELVKNDWAFSKDSKWYYHEADGKAVKGWKTIRNTKYYFDQGVMSIDVKCIDDQYYLFSDSGSLLGKVNNKDGWNLNGGYYYYVENGQVMKNTWKEINNKMYYFDSTGKMINDSKFYIESDDDSNYYSFNYDGSLRIDTWVHDSYGNWYYAGSEGALITGWKLIGNSWYYFDDCYMVSSNTIIDGKLYYFNSDGQYRNVSTDVSQLNGWVEDINQWYYLKNGKSSYKNSWALIDATWYYFDGDGAMATGVTLDNHGDYYYLDDSGHTVKNQWINDYGEWLYASADGKLLLGWQKINNIYYYFEPYAKMNTVSLIDGVYYAFDSNCYYLYECNPTEGWNRIDGNWYYCVNGKLIYNETIIEGNTIYQFDNNGIMITNAIVYKYDSQTDKYGYVAYDNSGRQVRRQWISINNRWYYADAQGLLYRNQTRMINGTMYSFDEFGAMM